MKLLVLAENYAKGTEYALLYIHTRNVEYLKSGFEVVVLNFTEKDQYEIDGIRVFGERSFKKNLKLSSFDLVISHAPNLKNHFRFLIGQFSDLRKIIFFIHGHEVLIKDKYYPEPYFYEKKKYLKIVLNYLYDRIKTRILKHLFTYILRVKKTHIIFVSEWMKEQFEICLKIDPKIVEGTSSVIPNPVNDIFVQQQYSPSENLEGDFISIRPFDGPKYCVDLIWKLAKANPEYKFTLYGRGNFFKYHTPPPNLIIHERFLKHSEIPSVLNKHRAALMLTRLDSQGVMACEMATYGIPLITSDIPLKRQMLQDMMNVEFLPNDLSKPLKDFRLVPNSDMQVKQRFSNLNTLNKELELFKQI